MKKIKIKIGRIMNMLTNEQIDDIGLNPWCLNAGLVTANHTHGVDIDKALEYNLASEDEICMKLKISEQELNNILNPETKEKKLEISIKLKDFQHSSLICENQYILKRKLAELLSNLFEFGVLYEEDLDFTITPEN